MAEYLTEDRAILIANAIRNDNFNVGSKDWCEYHNVTEDEFSMFLAAPARLASMSEYVARNPNAGSIDVEMTFTTHSGKVGSGEEKWAVMIPNRFTQPILQVAEGGKVIATLTPEQLSINVDALTGEIV